ncbi:hypothetical protein ACH4E8_14285 [Streptomyces sp. NPDC017979]|uniref:hypothetical protein n=1 Tax=Streptomyces sp. NPDC017979 TaxID=3365024 RepID=UPI00378C4BC5
MRRRRLALALSGIAASAFLIGGAGQLAKMVVPDGAASRPAASEVAPVLIGGFLIGGAAQFATEDGGQQGTQGRVVLAMNKAELVGA